MTFTKQELNELELLINDIIYLSLGASNYNIKKQGWFLSEDDRAEIIIKVKQVFNKKAQKMREENE